MTAPAEERVCSNCAKLDHRLSEMKRSRNYQKDRAVKARRNRQNLGEAINYLKEQLAGAREEIERLQRRCGELR